MLPEPELVAEVDQLCWNGRLQPYARKKAAKQSAVWSVALTHPTSTTASARALSMTSHTARDDLANIPLSCGGATESDDGLRRPRTGHH